MATDVTLNIRGKDKTGAAFRSANRNIQTLKLAAAGAVTAVTAIGAAFLRSTEQLDRFAKSAKDANVAVNTFRAWEFAATQAGVSTEQFAAGLGRANRRIGLFIQDGGGPAAKAFEQLGTSVRNASGEFLSNEAIIRQFVGQLEGVETQAERTALVTALFGDDARRLNLVFGQGLGALTAYEQKFADLGLVFSPEVIRNAEAFTDSQDQLARVFDAGLVKNTSALAPAFTGIAQALTEILKSGEDASNFFVGLNTLLTESAVKGLEVATSFQKIGTVIGGVAAAIKQASEGEIGAAQVTLRQITLDNEAAAAKLAEAIEILRNPNLGGGGGSGASGPGSAGSGSAGRTGGTATTPTGLIQGGFNPNLLGPQLPGDDRGTGLVQFQFDPNALGPQLEQAEEEITESAERISNTLSLTIFRGVSEGSDGALDAFKGLLANMLSQIAASGLQDAIRGIFPGLGGGDGGGFLGNLLSFDTGTDFVPGRIGQPRLAVVHGGESILRHGQSGGGGGSVYNVDARGATDPLAVELAVRRGVGDAVALSRRERIDSQRRRGRG